MSKRVIDVIVANCMITVKYSDCTQQVYPIADCTSDNTPPIDRPGPSPDPHETPDVKCRVAIKLAAQVVTNRYIDFLNAATPATIASFGIGLAAVVSAKLAAWAWSAALYPDLYVYGFNTVSSGDRDTALTYYNANESTVLNAAAEALFCVINSNGSVDAVVRQAWRDKLNELEDVVYTRLAEFLGIYPLERLRDEAFEASLTEDTVDCSAFECESDLACENNPITYQWRNQTEPFDDFEWEPMEGDTSQFPGFNAVVGYNAVIDQVRNKRGWMTGAQATASPLAAKAIALRRVFPTTHTLCRFTLANSGASNNDPNGAGNWFGGVRGAAVYFKTSSSPSAVWQPLVPIIRRGANNTASLILDYTGAIFVRELAIVCSTTDRWHVAYQFAMTPYVE